MVAVPKLDFSAHTFVIVDDESAILNLIAALVTSAGAKKVHKCKSAQEAQNVLTDPNVKVDCIISDHQMEPVTGLELLQKIRVGTNLGVSRNLRFLMLTGFGEEEVVKSALALDVDGYIIKPVSQGALIASIEKAFVRKRMLKGASDYAAVPVFSSPEP